MLHTRLRRPALTVALVISAITLAGCDMSLLTFAPQDSYAQKPRLTASPRTPAAKRAVAIPARDYHLGSGDRLGAASYAIYCDETLVTASVR